jgi:hypothetical protein
LNAANRVFQAFGFPVGKKKELDERWRSKGGNDRIPPTRRLLRTLFSQKWRLFPIIKEIRRNIPDRPGVYVLAYSDQRLQGKRVRESDVFYVGMACEGRLRARLQQFRQGIDRGGAHAGGDRFYRVWRGRKSYDPKAPTRFYFAYVPLNCEAAKPWRTPHDLLYLGKVGELEYAAIARVKSKIGHEPLLNWK